MTPFKGWLRRQQRANSTQTNHRHTLAGTYAAAAYVDSLYGGGKYQMDELSGSVKAT